MESVVVYFDTPNAKGYFCLSKRNCFKMFSVDVKIEIKASSWFEIMQALLCLSGLYACSKALGHIIDITNHTTLLQRH